MNEQNVVITNSIDYKKNCELCNHKLELRQKVALSNEGCFFKSWNVYLID